MHRGGGCSCLSSSSGGEDPPTRPGGDIAGNGISKLFLTIAAAFAKAERDRIRERIGQAKADQKSRGRFLGGDVPFGFEVGSDGALVPIGAQQEAIWSWSWS